MSGNERRLKKKKEEEEEEEEEDGMEMGGKGCGTCETDSRHSRCISNRRQRRVRKRRDILVFGGKYELCECSADVFAEILSGSIRRCGCCNTVVCKCSTARTRLDLRRRVLLDSADDFDFD